jgi:two-component system, cell cycle response regulator DivK
MSVEAPARPLVLLVEDNEAIRGAFSLLLEESGYRMAEAATGEEALRRARLDQPQLILMDLGLPDMNGLDAIRSLKAQPETQGIPIVALTGRALESDERACRAAGCTAYFAKPVNTRDLLDALGRLTAT